MQEEIYNFNMSIVHMYDKKISKLETAMKNYYFNNLPKDKLEGKIETPPYANKDSESVKIMRISGAYRSEIKRLEKEIQFPERYILRDISELLQCYELDRNTKNQLINELTQKEIEKRCIQIDQLEKRIKQVDEEPKWELRYSEFCSGDYSAVENEEVEKNLREMGRDIALLRYDRNFILDSMNEENVSKKRNKKSIKNMLIL